MSIKLNYKLTDPEERKQLVEKILEETPHPTEKYLEILADYLVAPVEKKDRKILTANRLATVNKRETSFEGLAEQMEGGEDTIYPLITNDKNQIFMHKVQITEEDVETVPFLRQVREAIEMWEQRLKSASGRSAYLIKKTIIDLRKDQYILKKAYQ